MPGARGCTSSRSYSRYRSTVILGKTTALVKRLLFTVSTPPPVRIRTAAPDPVSGQRLALLIRLVCHMPPLLERDPAHALNNCMCVVRAASDLACGGAGSTTNSTLGVANASPGPYEVAA